MIIKLSGKLDANTRHLYQYELSGHRMIELTIDKGSRRIIDIAAVALEWNYSIGGYTFNHVWINKLTGYFTIDEVLADGHEIAEALDTDKLLLIANIEDYLS